MNPLPPNADELVSAYLDGQAAPDEIIAVESSVELMERVQAMRAVSEQIGAAVVPMADQKEAHLAAALGEFDILFGSTDSSVEPEAGTLQSVPAPEAPVENQPQVVSFEAARERRRPRRFNTGVIAAAVAALLLIVGFAVLSGGRGSSDVASSAADSVEASQVLTESASDSSDAGDDEEEAMDDEETSAFGGLADAQRAPEPTGVALPTAAPPQAASATEAEADSAEEAMDDAAMAEEEAMDDAAMDEEASGAVDADTDAADLDDVRFFFGEFDDLDALEAALTPLSTRDLEARRALIGEGIFPRCQERIVGLRAVDTPTLLGDAVIAGEPREIHLTVFDDGGREFMIVDPSDCQPLAAFG